MNWMKLAEQVTIDYIRLLQEVVAIDSGTHNKAGVDAVGEFYAELLQDVGCQVKRHPLEEYGDCFEATLQGAGVGHILLLGHSDTVYPDGTAAQCPLVIQEDRILGPGTADMKGGLLLGVCALRTLRQANFLHFDRLSFFINSEEEIGSPMSRQLYLNIAKQADICLVLEAANPTGEIVSARKGTGTVQFFVNGKAAHAGINPEEGVSAIEALVRILGLLYLKGKHIENAAFSVGVIEGGIRGNVVADCARAIIDIRVENQEAWQQADALLNEVINSSQMEGIKVQRKGGVIYPPMPYTAVSELLVVLAQEQAGELGFQLPHAKSGGGSDANLIVASGTPTLDGLGPQGGLHHSPGEYILLDSVVSRTALLASLIPSLLEHRSRIRGRVSLMSAVPAITNLGDAA
jgi:glutamate carboxypeptidase